jgi:hypothetical protein
MLRHLREHIQWARQHATECRERALAASDEVLKEELLKLEQAWTSLAGNFENLQKMEEFLLDAQKSKGIEPSSSQRMGDFQADAWLLEDPHDQP